MIKIFFVSELKRPIDYLLLLLLKKYTPIT